MLQTQLLPSLHDKSRIRTGQPGEWNHQQGIAYKEVADSLERPEVGRNTRSISSIPNMWGRPLLVDIVLREDQHPLHESFKAEWKGMLAAIALAEVQGIKLRAELIDFQRLEDDAFIGALKELLPKKSAYQLRDNRNPWEKIYVFLLQDRPVGMTSPATLVCTAEDGNWEGVPWYKKGQLHSPLSPVDHLIEDDKMQLWLWLDNLRKQLGKEKGDSARIKQIIAEYQDELIAGVKLEGQNLRLHNNEQYFGVPLELGKVTAFSIPLQRPKRESSVKLVPSGRRVEETVYFIPEKEELLEQWSNKEPKYIQIIETNILTFNFDEFERKYRGKIQYLTKEDVFEDQFYFLKGAGMLPGALLPEGVEDITYIIDNQEHSLTPLLPLKTKIINYFSPEELIKRLKIHPATIGNQSGVRVKLTLPLSGGNYTISQDYPIQQDHAITAIPFLEIWPNFKAPNWKEYYTFYFDDRTAATQKKKTFRAVFPEAQEVQPSLGEIRDYQLNRLESFPDYIICQEETEAVQGLILLKTPPMVGDGNPNKTWTVGVDFGTSFTNVYYQINNYRVALSLSPLNRQVTQVEQFSRQGLLYKHFMSGKEEKFPLSSVLTIKGSKERERTVFDGRVYILEDILGFEPKQDDIKTELKWKTENLPHNRTFLNHLALLITAEAAQNGVRRIQWSIAYPSAFSRNDKNLYKVTWQQIIESLGAKTGLEHNWLSRGNPYRSESLAMAQYVSDEQDLLYTTCIDMGGGSSDISIWLGNRLIHQCSVQLAGRLLFCQFLKQRPDFLNQEFETDMSDLAAHSQDAPFFVKLDGILAAKGKGWLKTKRALMDDNSDLQEIVQLSTLGISGLYYYIGLVLKALDLEGKHEKKENTPIYIGGNACRILNWLDMSGTFTPECEAAILLSHMFHKASGYEHGIEETVLSTQPKAEVASGLVMDQQETRLRGLEDEDEDVFAGEYCIVNGETIEWCDRLNLQKFKTIESFTVKNPDSLEKDTSLPNLKQFLEDFHEAIPEKKIKSIKQLKHYNDEEWREKLWRSVNRKVEAELIKMQGRQADDIRPEPPFIIGLRVLLKELNVKMNKGG